MRRDGSDTTFRVPRSGSTIRRHGMTAIGDVQHLAAIINVNWSVRLQTQKGEEVFDLPTRLADGGQDEFVGVSRNLLGKDRMLGAGADGKRSRAPARNIILDFALTFMQGNHNNIRATDPLACSKQTKPARGDNVWTDHEALVPVL